MAGSAAECGTEVAGGEGFFACFEAAGDTGLAAGVAAGFGEDAGAAFVVAALAVAPFDVAAFGFFNAAPAEVNDWRGDAEKTGFLTPGEGDCFGAEEVADGELPGETAGALAAVPEGAMAGLVVAGTAGLLALAAAVGEAVPTLGFFNAAPADVKELRAAEVAGEDPFDFFKAAPGEV